MKFLTVEAVYLSDPHIPEKNEEYIKETVSIAINWITAVLDVNGKEIDTKASIVVSNGMDVYFVKETREEILRMIEAL